MSRTVSRVQVQTETLLELGDRVRYVDWPERVNRIGRKYHGPMRTREGRVIELYDAIYSEPERPGGLRWLQESEKAVVEFDDGSVDTIEGWRFLLALNDEHAVIRQLEVLS